MIKIINISQIIVAVILIVSILLQNRGAGLSGTFAVALADITPGGGLKSF